MTPPEKPEKLNPAMLSRVNLAGVLSRTGITKLTPAAIGNWLDGGCPRNPDKTYNIVHVCAWLAGKYGQTPYRPSPETDEEKRERIALIRARRLATDQSRRIEAGKLVDKDEVVREQVRRVHMAKSGLLSLERTLAREIMGVPQAQAEAVLKERINDLLLAYSEGWDGQGEIPKGLRPE